jgi:hypothetical protein
VNTVIPSLMHTPLLKYRLAVTIGGNDVQKLIDQRNAAVTTLAPGSGVPVAAEPRVRLGAPALPNRIKGLCRA